MRSQEDTHLSVDVRPYSVSDLWRIRLVTNPPAAKPYSKKKPYAITWFFLLFGLFAVNAYLQAKYNLWVNYTNSVPAGLYSFSRMVGNDLKRDSYVAFCPTQEMIKIGLTLRVLDRGHCPGDVEPLLKKVVATEGDVVTVLDSGILVNGKMVPNTKRQNLAKVGIPMIPKGRYVVPPGKFWPIGTDLLSWDARYYGAMSVSQIMATAVPFFTWGKMRQFGGVPGTWFESR